MLENETNTLINAFLQIKAQDYLKEIEDLGIEKTFQKLIPLNSKDIIIKIKRDLTFKPYKIFTAPLEGKSSNELKRLCQKYGAYEVFGNHIKALNANIRATNTTLVGDKYLFTLYIDYEKERLNLLVYDKYYNVIDNNSYWPFEVLKKKFNKRPKYIFWLKAWSKTENKTNYFKYYDYSLGKLIDFPQFLKLIKEGIISVTINFDSHKPENQKINFEIEEYEIAKLYPQLLKN